MIVTSNVLNNYKKNMCTSQKTKKDFSFKGYNFVKTLEKADIDSSESKYFKNGIPILAKYVPPVYFGVQKYVNEASRFLVTDAAICCTKLTLHDPITKTGIVSHLNSVYSLINNQSVEGVKKVISGLNTENIFVRHLKSVMYTEKSILDATLEFMQKLKIPEKNLIEEDLFSAKTGAPGILLDIKTGQTYNIQNAARISSQSFDIYEKTLSPDEFKTLLKNQKIMHNFNLSSKPYLVNIDESSIF